MIIKNSVFDSITNSEDEMIKRANIKESQACVYLRAYIIIRLLFFDEFIISDSSINLNRALRTLIDSGERKRTYDLRKVPEADFGELIRNGSIKLAARDIYKNDFFRSFSDRQMNKKLVDLPGENYTKIMNELCNGLCEEDIYWWNEKRVSQMFTKNIRDELKTEFSDDINLFLRELSNRLSNHDVLTYNMVKNEALKNCEETSEEYQIVRTMLRNAYDYNVPEVLKTDYLRLFNSPFRTIKQSNSEIYLAEQYDMPWKYSFNIYAFTLLSVRNLKNIKGHKESIRYREATLQYMNGTISFKKFLEALEAYLNLIDDIFTELYGKKYGEGCPKNIVLRIREYAISKHPAILTLQGLVWAYGTVTTLADLNTNIRLNGMELLLATILPNIIFKTYDHFTALPKIKHAIVKLGESK